MPISRDGRPTDTGVRGHRRMISPTFREYAGRRCSATACWTTATSPTATWRSWSTPLESYKVVLAPTHFITDPDVVARLEDFVQKGGTVVTCRSGVKDKNGNCILGQELPTLFRGLCGCHVTEYDAIGPACQKLALERGGSGYKGGRNHAVYRNRPGHLPGGGIDAGGQMHGLVVLDRDGNVIRPAILWNDGRTAKKEMLDI